MAHWKFNANDGTPIPTVTVARSGAFAFSYRPSYCASGSFEIHGVFGATRFVNVPNQALFRGMTGYLVTFTARGSCEGQGNTFTWRGARGVATGFASDGKWPDSRFVQGEMTQVATTAGSSGPLTVDWGMSAVYGAG